MRGDERGVKFALIVILSSLLLIFGITSFVVGYFPPRLSAPGIASPRKYVELDDHTKLEYPRAAYDRLILMLVDALRSDFVYSNNSEMHFARRLIQQGNAVPYVAFAHPPTVTLPRIKALTSGGIPSFMDYVHNFNGKEFTEDNIVLQFLRCNKSMIMFGDDTWLKLFPNYFLRSDGTTSFFVADTVEVDLNVTRHIDEELQRSDWDVMILHYLGLDHIGHFAGPTSALMPLKQREMDSVLQKLYTSAESLLTNNGTRTLIVLVGDHGMNEIGNHGGSSSMETSSALLFASPSLNVNPMQQPQQALQIDLVPTVSVLLGIPIPRNSLGSILRHLFQTDDELLAALAANAQQKYEISQATSALWSTSQNRLTELTEYFIKAKKLHVEYMMAKDLNISRNATNYYYMFLEELGRLFASKLTEYNMYMLYIGTISAAHACITLLVVLLAHHQNAWRWSTRNTMLWFIAFVLLHVFVRWWTQTPVSMLWVAIHVILSTVLVAISQECFISWSTSINWPTCWETNTLNVFVIGFLLFHLASFGASSFIEEEHQSYYFANTTILLLCILLALKREKDFVLTVWLLLATVVFRLATKWNQTGNKWIGQPDIALFLTTSSLGQVVSRALVVVSLGFISYVLYATSFDYNAKPNNSANGFMRSAGIFGVIAALLTLVYKLNIAPQWVITPITLAKLCYLVILATLLLLAPLIRSRNTRKRGILACATIFCILAVLLHKLHNAALFMLFLLQGLIYIRVATKWSDTSPLLITIWGQIQGMAAWFCLGNSNSLSTIDISGAYTGLTEYNQVIVGVLVYLICYSGPLLFTIFTCAILSSRSRLQGSQWKSAIVALLVERAASITVFCVIATSMRYHLFVWSVFSPKLAYEVLHTLNLFTNCILLLFMCT